MVQNMRFRLNNYSECNDDFITGNLNHKYLTYDSLVGLESMETDSKPTKLKPDDVYDLFGIKRPSEGLRYGIQVAYQFGLSAILLVIKRDEVNRISSEAVKVRTISEWVNFYQKIFKVREALLKVDPSRYKDAATLKQEMRALIEKFGRTSFEDPDVDFEELLVVPKTTSCSAGSSGYTDPKQLRKLIECFIQDFDLHKKGEQYKAKLAQKRDSSTDAEEKVKYNIMMSIMRLPGPEYEPFRDMEEVVVCADEYLRSVLE